MSARNNRVLIIETNHSWRGWRSSTLRKCGFGLLVLAIAGAVYLTTRSPAPQKKSGTAAVALKVEPITSRDVVGANPSPAPVTADTPASAPVKPMAAASCGVALAEAQNKQVVDVLGTELWEYNVGASTQAARSSVVQLLLASGDAQTRAAGLLLSAREKFIAAAPTNCAANEDCLKEFRSQSKEAALKSVSELAALARRHKIASIYGWALSMCGAAKYEHGSNLDQCSALSILQWAELAPQNAWPWLALAGEASQRRDYSGIENAMNHAAQATDWRASSASLGALVTAQLPPDVQGLPRMALLSESVTFIAMDQSHLQALTSFCSSELDANRVQSCARMAENLLNQTDSLLGLNIALRVGERAGFSADRLKVVREERDALSRLEPLKDLATATGMAQYCAGVDKAVGYLQSQIEVGELGALRLQLKAAGAHINPRPQAGR